MWLYKGLLTRGGDEYEGWTEVAGMEGAALVVRGRLGKEGFEMVETGGTGAEGMGELEVVEERKGIGWEVVELERTGVEVMEGFGGGG